MPEQDYPYSLSADFPGGAIDSTNLMDEIAASAIATGLNRIDVTGNAVSIVFASALSAGDKTILDNDTTGPAGGLIAAHDNEESNLPVAHTGDAILSASGGRYHTNEGAGAKVTLTLPDPKALAPDDLWIFEVTDAKNLELKPLEAVTIGINGNDSIPGGKINSDHVGSLITLAPSRNNKWTAIQIVGYWDLETS